MDLKFEDFSVQFNWYHDVYDLKLIVAVSKPFVITVTSHTLFSYQVLTFFDLLH